MNVHPVPAAARSEEFSRKGFALHALYVTCALILASASVPLSAQESSPGRVDASPVGEVGQRQARDQEVGRVQPAPRINSRIANRVQSRLRNRIDRNYDPQANALSPFAVADEQQRSATRRPRRR